MMFLEYRTIKKHTGLLFNYLQFHSCISTKENHSKLGAVSVEQLGSLSQGHNDSILNINLSVNSPDF